MSGPYANSTGNPKVMGHWDWGLDRQPDLTSHGIDHPFRISLGVRPMIIRGRFGTPCRSIKNYPHQQRSSLKRNGNMQKSSHAQRNNGTQRSSYKGTIAHEADTGHKEKMVTKEVNTSQVKLFRQVRFVKFPYGKLDTLPNLIRVINCQPSVNQTKFWRKQIFFFLILNRNYTMAYSKCICV